MWRVVRASFGDLLIVSTWFLYVGGYDSDPLRKVKVCSVLGVRSYSHEVSQPAGLIPPKGMCHPPFHFPVPIAVAIIRQSIQPFPKSPCMTVKWNAVELPFAISTSLVPGARCQFMAGYPVLFRSFWPCSWLFVLSVGASLVHDILGCYGHFHDGCRPVVM